jgi:hypothetical protein
MTHSTRLIVLRVLVVSALVIALICVVAPTTVLGAGPFAWTLGALVGWAAEPLAAAL